MDTLQKIYNTITFNDVPIILQYLTTWSILLLLMHKYVHKYIDILLVATIVMVTGTYVSHVHPKRFTLNYTKDTIIVDGLFKILTADVLHISLFVLALIWYGRFYVQNTNKLTPLMGAIALLIVYYIVNNPSKLYGIDNNEIASLFSIIILCYVLVLAVLNMKNT